jgi:uncharacterized protein
MSSAVAPSGRVAPVPARDRSAMLAEHSPVLSGGLHLLPGVLTGAVYLLLSGPVRAAGYPSLVALNLAVLIALVPYVMGLLLYLGYRSNGRPTLKGVVLYRERPSLPWFIAHVAFGFGASLVLIAFVLDKLVSPVVQSALFGWMPVVDWGLGGGHAKAVMVASYVLVAVATCVCEPIVEELYFRGFLLPRMRYAGGWTVPLQSFLYAAYHVWYPWRLVTLAIGMTPLVYAVSRTRSVYVGLAIHFLLNSFYLIFGVVYILGMR